MIRKLAVLAFCVSMASVMNAQESGERRLPQPEFTICKPDDWLCLQMENRRKRALNQERHSDLKQDTDKLLQLAQELKDAVDQSNEHTLSLDVVRKCEEIEKLAKSVRKKMRGE